MVVNLEDVITLINDLRKENKILNDEIKNLHADNYHLWIAIESLENKIKQI